MRNRTKELVQQLAIGIGLVLLGFLIGQTTAWGAAPPLLTVDGVQYEATKVTPGGTVHFETPDINPQVAFTERNTWTGNGSDNLPCPGGIHWIDNNNTLTISHCLEATNTTQPTPSTTTTLPSSITTMVAETTTTVMSEPTTTVPLSTTTTEGKVTIGTQPPCGNCFIPPILLSARPAIAATVAMAAAPSEATVPTATASTPCTSVITIVVTAAATPTPGPITSEPPTETSSTVIECMEDEPCWDCETMGNRVCGEELPRTGMSFFEWFGSGVILLVLGSAIVLLVQTRRY